jgi:hypothetical protein
LSYSRCIQFVISSTCHIGPSHLPNIFHSCRSSKTRGRGGWWNAEGVQESLLAQTRKTLRERVGDEKILRSFTYSSFITLARNRVEVDRKKGGHGGQTPLNIFAADCPQSFLLCICEHSSILFSLLSLARERFSASTADFSLQKSHKIPIKNIMTFSSPVSMRTTIPPSPPKSNYISVIYGLCRLRIVPLWLPTTHTPPPNTRNNVPPTAGDCVMPNASNSNWPIRCVFTTKTANRRLIRGGERVTF